MKKEEYAMLLEKLNLLADREFFLSHLRIGLQKISEDPILKRSCIFTNLEAYLFVRFESEDDTYSYIKVNDGALEVIQCSAEEAWKTAFENVRSEMVIRPLIDRFMDFTESEFEEAKIDPEDLDPEDIKDIPGLYIVSNEQYWNGASSILVRDEMEKFAEEHGYRKWIVLPSSKHEMLIYPYLCSEDLEDLSKTVKEVTENGVDPEDQLDIKAYLVDFGKEEGNAEYS